MTSIVQQDPSISLCPTSLFPKTPTIKKDRVSSPVFGMKRQISPGIRARRIGILAGLSRIRAGWYSRSMIDSRPNGSWPRLGHLQVGDDVIDSTDSTRLSGVVQAMSKHTWRTHVIFSESKTSWVI